MQDQYSHDEAIKTLQYLGAKKVYRRVMTQKLPMHGLVQKQKLNDFIPKKIDNMVIKTRKNIFQKLMQSILKSCTRFIMSCHFSEENENGKVEKLVPNLNNKKSHVVYIKNMNQPLTHDLKWRKVHSGKTSTKS